MMSRRFEDKINEGLTLVDCYVCDGPMYLERSKEAERGGGMRRICPRCFVNNRQRPNE